MLIIEVGEPIGGALSLTKKRNGDKSNVNHIYDTRHTASFTTKGFGFW